MQTYGLESVRRDLERSGLPDERLRARAGKLGARICVNPERGLPRLLDKSELEAGYRFVNNDRVTYDAILAGHRDASLERAAGMMVALSLQDTTAFVFGGEEPREGLGLDNQGRGFSAHFGLLASADGERRPLGVVSMEPIFRHVRHDSERKSGKRYHADDKESLRWIRMVDDIEEHCGPTVDLIHVMDSEADWYDLLEHMHRHEHRFVVRMTHERKLLGTRGQPLISTPSELMGRVAAIATREVALSKRTGKGKAPNSKKKHPARPARTAQLEIAARSVTIARPPYSVAPSESITLNLVHVREVRAPDGCEPGRMDADDHRARRERGRHSRTSSITTAPAGSSRNSSNLSRPAAPTKSASSVQARAPQHSGHPGACRLDAPRAPHRHRDEYQVASRPSSQPSPIACPARSPTSTRRSRRASAQTQRAGYRTESPAWVATSTNPANLAGAS